MALGASDWCVEGTWHIVLSRRVFPAPQATQVKGCLNGLAQLLG
jgi:hypothetical protein